MKDRSDIITSFGTSLYLSWMYSEVVLVGNCTSTIHRIMADIHVVQSLIIWILYSTTFSKTRPSLENPNWLMSTLSLSPTCDLGKPLLKSGCFFRVYLWRCSELEEQRKYHLNRKRTLVKQFIDPENTDKINQLGISLW